MKRANGKIDGRTPKEWMDYMFDHTVVMATDDPALETCRDLDKQGFIQLREVPATGAERFAQFIYDKVNPFIMDETNGRVKIAKVEFREHGKNSAIYEPGQD
jgi:6-pyruvoyltetrahydropterin/6-carboxytetrahydropterin synthase